MVELLVIWGTKMFMWRHSNDIVDWITKVVSNHFVVKIQ